jgi:uncharacterized protein YdhG (YjbR/CyaY superfamily)
VTTAEPLAIADYLADVDVARRALIEHYYARVPGLVDGVEIGRSYAMPCYLHRGKGLISVMATRPGLSVIPFSGAVTQQLQGAHGSLDVSAGSGSIRVTVAAPLPDTLFDELVRLRAAEIEAKVRR